MRGWWAVEAVDIVVVPWLRWVDSGIELAHALVRSASVSLVHLCHHPRTMPADPSAAPLIGSLPLGTPLAGENLQRWLYRTLRQAMLAGRLPADSLLPGSRSLALQHGLARGT